MPLHTTAGALAVNAVLPEDLRDYTRVLDKKGIANLMQEVAEKYPERYRQIMHDLSRVGYETAAMTGGYSFGLKHMRTSLAARQQQLGLKSKIQAIQSSGGTPEQKNHQIVEELMAAAKPMEDAILKESLDEKNPLGLQVLSGARGNAMNLRSLRGGDLLYVDHHDRPLPIPILRSFSQGLSPVEYFAGSFGARKGVSDVKFATQDAGFFSKQLNQVAHRLVVTARDRDKPSEHLTGMPVDTDDPDNEGAVLAHDIAGYKRNTVLTPKILSDIKSKGIDRLLVRSPIVGGPEDGGVYAADLGVREKGNLPPIGDYVGIAAAQALCLAAGTLILMADGSTKPIEEIKAGDKVYGCSVAGEVRPVDVLATVANGPRKCLRAVFRRGTGKICRESFLELIATSEHKLLSEIVVRSGRSHSKYFHPIGIRPLDTDVKRHDAFCARLSRSFNDTGFVDEPRALLLGSLIGDGCYTGEALPHGISFSCHDPVQVEDFGLHLLRLGYELVASVTPGEFRLVDRQPFYADGGPILGERRHRCIAWLQQLGLWGQYSGEKILPPVVFTWNNRSIADLLAGLIATDGFVTSNGMVGFSSNSRKLLEQIKLLLQLRFGVPSSAIAWSIKKHKNGSNYDPNYRFVVSGADSVKTLAAVLSIPGVKQKRLQKAAQRKSKNDSRRCRLITRQELGELPTFDIYINHPDHLFVLANGLIVSNSEPLSQAQLSSKHSGGVAGAAKGVSGFKLVNQLIQVPKHFKGAAAHAQVDGKVQSIREAPQGGHFIAIGGQEHYVGTGYALKVRPGDAVEAGDVLSEGIPNPSEIEKHKGVGEARRYFTHLFQKSYKDSGIPAHRRNVELMARGLINHVRLTEEMGDYVPGDIVPYSRLEHFYKPRTGHQTMEPKRAEGMYLERPVLHYSIGTKVRPSVVKQLDEFGIKNVTAHRDPPPFESEMIRGMENISHDPDVLTRFLGSYQKKNLLSAVHRGGESDEMGTSYVPALARAENFGREGKTIGYKTGPGDSILKDLHTTTPKHTLT